MKKVIFLFLSIATPFAISFAELNEGPVYTVVVQENPSLVEKVGKGAYIGFEIDLWNEIANRANLNFKLEDRDTFPEVLEAVRNGEADFALAGISIRRDRANQMTFSQPYLSTGLTGLTYRKSINVWTSIETLFSALVLKTIALFFSFCLIFGFLFWITEKNLDNDISPKFIPGIFDGIWYAFKKSWGVQTHLSRLLTIPLWVVTLLFTSLITAQVITNFEAVSQDNTFQKTPDYSQIRLGIISNTVSEIAIADIEDDFELLVKLDSYEALYQNFKEQKVTHILGDAPLIQHFKKRAEDDRLDVVQYPGIFTEDYYGVAINFGIGWRLTRDIDRAIMELRDNGFIKKLKEKWDIADGGY